MLTDINMAQQWFVFTTAVVVSRVLAPGEAPWATPQNIDCGNAGVAQTTPGAGQFTELLVADTSAWTLPPPPWIVNSTEITVDAMHTLSGVFRVAQLTIDGMSQPDWTDTVIPGGGNYSNVTRSVAWPGKMPSNITLQGISVGSGVWIRVRCLEYRVLAELPETTATTAPVTTSALTTAATTAAVTTGVVTSGSVVVTTGTVATTGSGSSVPVSPPPSPPPSTDTQNKEEGEQIVATGIYAMLTTVGLLVLTPLLAVTIALREKNPRYSDPGDELDETMMKAKLGEFRPWPYEVWQARMGPMRQHVLAARVRLDVATNRNERQFVMALFHDNLAPCLGFVTGGFLALYGMGLRGEFLKKSGRPSTKIAHDIAKALTYLHGKGHYHGAVILSKVIYVSNRAQLTDWCGVAGQHAWRSYDTKPDADSDVWDLGWLMWQLHQPDGAHSEPCLDEQASRNDFWDQVVRGGQKFVPPQPGCTIAEQTLMLDMWATSPGARPIAGAVVKRLEQMNEHLSFHDHDSD